MSATPDAGGARPFVLGLAEERQSGFSAELMRGVEASAAELGWGHVRVNDAQQEASCDVLLAIGNVRLFPDLLRRRKAAARVLWHGEILPRPTDESGSTIHSLLPTGRLLDTVFAVAPGAERVTALRHRREQAAIVREPLANLKLLQRAFPAFDRVVVDSHDRAEGALRAGLPVSVVPYGYHESYAGPLQAAGDRPRDALLLAHMVGRHGRRQRLVALLERQLAERGYALTRLTSGTYGRRRSEILGRTRVVVDIHRLPGNYPGFRFIVASAAGAALVSEPLARPEPLIPGVHYVEAREDGMANAVAALLADEAARLRQVEVAQALLSGELHMSRVLPKVLDGLVG